MSPNLPPQHTTTTQDGAALLHPSGFAIPSHGIIFHCPKSCRRSSPRSDAGIRWRGLVFITLLPLVLGAQTRPMENESRGWGLAIMWPMFVCRSNNQPIIVVYGREDFGEWMMRSFPRRSGQRIERYKNINDKIYFVVVDGRQTIERHTTTNQKWQKQLVRCGCDGELEKWAGWDILLRFNRRSD